MKEAFASFWESTGVVLLQPQVPNPNDLVTRFIPVLDRFLTASSINVHEPVDESKDPRKHAFVTRVRATRRQACGRHGDGRAMALRQPLRSPEPVLPR